MLSSERKKMSVFVDAALAARVERAEAELMAASTRAIGERHDVATFQVPLGGGFATYAGPDSPFNKVAGLGFHYLLSGEELTEVEDHFAEYDCPVSFEISTLANPELAGLLTGRGYQLVSFENVLLLRLESAESHERLPDIDIRRAEDQLQVWLDVAVEASLNPDTAGIAQHESFPPESLEWAELAMADAGARLYLATLEGQPAGAAGVRFTDGLAQLTGAGTLPAFRRRGVQKALVGTRLRDARAAGCSYAVVTTQPGSTSHANMQRSGFDLAYSRAVLVGAGRPDGSL
jgi:ribosomal protein S18 acetylase RimI-like enzyme